MKYSDYNLVIMDFLQDSPTSFRTKDYTQLEMDAILAKMKKSNIIMATVTTQAGISSIHAGCIQSYTSDGFPVYSFTDNNVTFALNVTVIGDYTPPRYRFTFSVVQ